MGKTHKYIPHNGQHRSPRGRKKALLNDARPGSIPPDPWDDESYDDQNYQVRKIAEKLHKEGKDDDEIITKLARKFETTTYIIRQHFDSRWMGTTKLWFNNCRCQRCTEIWNMKRYSFIYRDEE